MSELIGKELGPYRILELIGTGGMATVYKAYHATLNSDAHADSGGCPGPRLCRPHTVRHR
jgi:serine/threonine protein kinase